MSDILIEKEVDEITRARAGSSLNELIKILEKDPESARIIINEWINTRQNYTVEAAMYFAVGSIYMLAWVQGEDGIPDTIRKTIDFYRKSDLVDVPPRIYFGEKRTAGIQPG